MTMNKLPLIVAAIIFHGCFAHAEIVTQYRFDGNLEDTAGGGSTNDVLEPIFIGGDGDTGFEEGVVGQAVRLDLAVGNAFVLSSESSDDLNLESDWTLEAFIKPDLQNAGQWDRFWTKWGEGSNDWHWAFRYDNNGQDYFMNGGQVFDGQAGLPENSVIANQWSHVAVIGDSQSGEIRGYLNGTEVVSGAYSEPIPGVSNMNFGNFAHGGNTNGLQFTGLIDEAMIHNTTVDDDYLMARAEMLPAIEPPDMSVAAPPASGLVAYYHFDDSINDVAGDFGHNTGSVADHLEPRDGDANFADGRIGRALSIGVDPDDATDFRAELSDDLTLAEVYTIEAWVYPTELDDSWQRLVLNWGAEEQSYHFAIRNNSGFNNGVSLFHEQEDGAQPNANGGTVELEEWQHIAGVADGDKLSVYLNGELVGQASYDGTINQSIDEGLGIADSDTALSGIKYNGLLDDLAIWTVPLTNQQIRFQYQQGLLGNNALTGGVTGDFDGNGELDVADIDLLSLAIRNGEQQSIYDLNADESVDRRDRFTWIEEVKNTYVGDSNLDGEFSTADFVQVFEFGEYEDGIAGNSSWAEGDWDGNGDFESGDFVIAFQSGGFELGPRVQQTVPEPNSLLLITLGILCTSLRGQPIRRKTDLPV